MINLLHAEWFKLRKSTAFKISLLITTVCAVVLAVVSHGVAEKTMSIDTNSMSGLSDIFIMSVLGSLMTGILICSDFETKTIHDAITTGRRKIVVSKVISYILMISLLVLPYAIVSFICFVSKEAFQEQFTYSTYLGLMGAGQSATIDGPTIEKAIVVLVISLLLYAARSSICIPIAFRMKKPVVVTVLGVVFGFLIDFVISICNELPLLDQLVKVLPYSYVKLSIEDGYGQLLKVLMISLIFLLFITIVTYRLFRKAEIK